MMLDTAAPRSTVSCAATPRDAEQAERILTNRFYRNISGALSGTQEYMAAETLHQLHGDERFDVVVVDTPPSRNALDFLEAPSVLARLPRPPPVPAADAPGPAVAWGSSTRPPSRSCGRSAASSAPTSSADAVALFQAFAGMEGGFRQRAEEVIELPRSDDTVYVIVASPHRDTVTEAVRFAGKIAEHGISRARRRRPTAPRPSGFGTACRRHGPCRPPRRATVRRRWRRNVAALRWRWPRRPTASWRRSLRCPPTRPLGRRCPLLAGRRPRPRRARRDPAPSVRRDRDARRRPVRYRLGAVKVLLADGRRLAWSPTSVAALGGPETSSTVCLRGTRGGRHGRGHVDAGEDVDVAIFDLQIGSMGGMAVTMSMRLDESSGTLPARAGGDAARPHRRRHLAKRSGADGWLVKPLDPPACAGRAPSCAATPTTRASSTVAAACSR